MKKLIDISKMSRIKLTDLVLLPLAIAFCCLMLFGCKAQEKCPAFKSQVEKPYLNSG